MAAGTQDGIVAGILAFDAHLPGQPPHGRMKEQAGLDQPLQQIGQQIIAVDVGQFVQQHIFELPAGQARGQRAGNKIIGRSTPTTTGTETREHQAIAGTARRASRAAWRRTSSSVAGSSIGIDARRKRRPIDSPTQTRVSISARPSP